MSTVVLLLPTASIAYRSRGTSSSQIGFSTVTRTSHGSGAPYSSTPRVQSSAGGVYCAEAAVGTSPADARRTAATPAARTV
ncbi:hypothetical protein [Cellulomonas sp. JZ18]|uniref:hypothetical protein n=1 Tax=Cellulomonas sp. JZ18 TaxID=2654191 RepID=UPI001E2CCF1D|nr:hypothetical protein [Cellulomonas sp. JZ18]